MAIPEKPKLDPIPLPDEPGLLGGWGRKLEITLLRFLLDTFNSVMSPFWEMRDNAAKYLFQSIEDELKPVIEPLLDMIDANENVPPWIRAMTKHLRFSEPFTFTGLAIAVIAGSIVMLIIGAVQPVGRVMSQEVDGYIHSARMTPQEAFVSLKRGEITETDFHNHLSDGGWSEKLEDVWKVILSPLLDIGDLGRLFTRKELTESQFDIELGKRGYRSEEKEKIKTLLHIIPPLTDIIQMAVREAFTPDVVERFQLHAELPSEMVEWASKQGLSEEWSEAYWAAHWTLPSLGLGYEMLHRDEITEAEMQMLIKAQDISPFWRDRLLNISYSPYTRVDVRRMYNTKVIGVEEVKRNYLDLGSNEEHAQKLTEFTVALSQATERDLSKTDVLYGYEVGYFNPKETDDLLSALGYDQQESDYYKAKTDYKRWKVMVRETVKSVGLQYMANQIEQTAVYGQLGALNLPSEQINRHIREWDLKISAKIKRLTATTLAKFRKQEVIEDGDFTTEMAGLGYSQRYIDWFLRELDIKKAPKIKRPTTEALSKFRKQDIIGDGDFKTEMSELGYSQRYIDWFLKSLRKKE